MAHRAPRHDLGPGTSPAPSIGTRRAGGLPAGAPRATDRPAVPPTSTYRAAGSDRPTGGFRRVSGVLDRYPDQTGPMADPWWSAGDGSHPAHPLSARHSAGDRPGSDWESGARESAPRTNYHPSAPLPPLPGGAWDRLRARAEDDEDGATVAHGRPGGPPPGGPAHASGDSHRAPRRDPSDDERTDAHAVDASAWEDQTGGLDVIGAHVDDDASRRWWRRQRPTDRPAAGRDAAGRPVGSGAIDPHDDLSPEHPDVPGRDARRRDSAVPSERDHDVHGYDEHAYDEHGYDEHAYDEYDAVLTDDDIPVVPYDPRSGRRRRRRPLAVLLALLVLGGLVVGIVVGGEKLLTMLNLSSRDYTGQGTGTAEVRISQGDTLSDIARTLVEGDVIASIGPFIDAAEADPAATGIQPGVYRLRQQMSGQAAVDLLLDPASRLVSRITLPEGLTVKATLTKLAESTGTPIQELEAAAADPAALGLPDYANGMLEGFLFPATYDFEPDTTPAGMLEQMVSRAVHALDELQIPPDQRLTVLTKASLVQSEASTPEDMAKVARVLENRLADGMPLQLDSTVNYANDKGGITTTATDRANPSPYNTYKHAGLPPGAISNPGEDALRAVLSPADGDWRFFVVVDPETGDTRFAVTGEEHQQNVLLFQQWLRENPGN
jgi:UPF0755 protein